MAEERPGGEPTEPPSEKRLRDARLRGEVAKSRELTSAAGFLAAASMLAWTWPDIFSHLRNYMQSALQQVSLSETQALPDMAIALGLRTFWQIVLPTTVVVFIVALLAALAHVGPIYSLHPVKPNLRRLDPTQNLRNIFGKEALFELLKAIIKILGIGYVGFDALGRELPKLLTTLGQAPEAILQAAVGCLIKITINISVVVAILAAGDLLYQRLLFSKRLRMTKTELQREQKESEGDPHHKAERQRVHREVLEHQELEAVVNADCIIINPDHVAVAIRYDETSMKAPQVIARGHRLLAAKMREIARQRGIPIIRNVPLARALMDLELDQEIPAELYEAVAEILRFVYQWSGKEKEERAQAEGTVTAKFR